MHQAGTGSDTWKTVLQQYKAMWLTPLNYTAADFQQIASAHADHRRRAATTSCTVGEASGNVSLKVPHGGINDMCPTRITGRP